jgi:UDP-N-acetylmuramate--alanine ligase
MNRSLIRSFPVSQRMSLDVGRLHFVGIGGIGMSGIAEVLHNLGYQVQGSDMSDSANLDRLRGLGIEVFVGHDAAHVEHADVVVISSAVKPQNPEVMAAREKRIPVVRRAEMLAELMRLKMTVSVAGTHGKTTTTSLITALFEAAGRNPTVINGGIINAYGTNAVLGKGDWMIVEADESDGTFIKIPSHVAVITNIDPEHLDHYGSWENLKAAFKQFLDNLPFYGFGVLCMDHPEVQHLVGQITDRRIITYGLSAQADVRAVNVEYEGDGICFDVIITEPQTGESRRIDQMRLPMFGTHNLTNSLAAIAVASELGMEDDALRRGLAGFGGVKRRFTLTGEVSGIRVIDDYAHHPVEIMATLSSARKAADVSGGRVIAVMQPHRYSRLRDLFEQFATCFNQADKVLVAPVYEAGESPIEGFDRDTLVAAIRRHGHKDVVALEGEEALAAAVAEVAQPGDFVICMGAGSVTKWAAALPQQLEALLPEVKRA